MPVCAELRIPPGRRKGARAREQRRTRRHRGAIVPVRACASSSRLAQSAAESVTPCAPRST
eukprot:2239439-Pleurochrysis_carterae.AAC.2